MNIKISPAMMKWQKEIDEAFGGPMFFVFDDQLVNLYSYLSRLSDNELREFCKDEKFAKMCSLVTSERKSDFGQLSSFANERGMLNIEGLMPILASFPTFNDAMNFIMRIKPGFRYSKEFKDFVEKNIVIENGIDEDYDDVIIYTLGHYQYVTKSNTEQGNYAVEYRKLIDDRWQLHRLNGPALITLISEEETLYLVFYREGKLYLVDDEYTTISYKGNNEIFDYIEYNSNNESNIVELPYNILKVNEIDITNINQYYYNGEYNFAYQVHKNIEKSRGKMLTLNEKYVHNPGLDRFVLVEKYELYGHNEKVTRYNNDGNIAYVEKNSSKPPFKSAITYYNPDGTIKDDE